MYVYILYTFYINVYKKSSAKLDDQIACPRHAQICEFKYHKPKTCRSN